MVVKLVAQTADQSAEWKAGLRDAKMAVLMVALLAHWTAESLAVYLAGTKGPHSAELMAVSKEQNLAEWKALKWAVL